ncbi:hypothetical protein QWY84_07920 [Aquisalimonas lutea]|uniref:hypothetical protein n=1 Tax=Aquisalimonas lutea TaxID=1327750 RepID=UPI0025B584CA|nr:hypothetical protein [Aquisalimonas lutea]MDN3517531.1 hypothetical protein [Aquisalimonas lutea]
MKTLSEKMAWVEEGETRRWKRVVNCVELLFFALAQAAVVSVLYVYGDGSHLQPVFMLFSGLMGVVSAALIPSFYRGGSFSRWHGSLVTLGLACGLGLSTAAAMVLLNAQSAGT